MTAEIIAFITAVNHTANIAKAVIGTRDAAKIALLQLEFSTALLDLQEKQLAVTQAQEALLDEIKSLKQQLAAYEQWKEESQRYQLHELKPGILVYVLKPEHAAAEPKHWLCAGCYNNGKKSILQKTYSATEMLACPNSGQHMITTRWPI